MKKIIRKTGEIIDVITYSCDTIPDKRDTVNYIDSEGNYKTGKLNYYIDLEDLDDNTETVYWNNFRNNAALSILSGLCVHGDREFWERDVDLAVKMADNLVVKLKINKKN